MVAINNVEGTIHRVRPLVLEPGIALTRKFLSTLLSAALIVATVPLDGCKKSEEKATVNTAGETAAPPTTYAVPTPDQLNQLVAPIALYADNLVGLVLAASTYPDQVVEAYRWLKANSSLKGADLQQAADQQSWDGSVKALTDFPQILDQLNTNLTWTSALGDAYYNDQQSVLNAVQVMRQRAVAAGTLKSNEQQTVSVQNTPPAAPQTQADGQQIVAPPPQTIIIQPAQPTIVYVPTYNPTVVYGAPVPPAPGYSTGAMVATGLISFGLGIAVGAAINNNNNCCGWGYNSWGCNWHGGTVVYNRNIYVSNSNTFVNRNNYYNNRNNYNGNRPVATPYNNNNRPNVNNTRPAYAGTTGAGTYDRPNANNNRPNVNQTRPATNDLNRGNMANNRPATNDLNRPNGANNRPATNDLNRGNMANNRPATNDLNRPNGANNRPATNDLNRGNMANNRPSTNDLNQNRPSQNQPSQDQARSADRGYGQQPAKTSSGGAFNGYSPGGNARADSARGQQSMNTNRQAPSTRPSSGGGKRPSGGAKPSGGSRR